MPLPGFTMRSPHALAKKYRYLRFHLTAVNGSSYFHVNQLDWMVSGVSYPTQTMTDYSAPSPLVITYSADNGSDNAWEIYDDSATTTGWQAGSGVTDGWVSLDLGDGNGIAPT